MRFAAQVIDWLQEATTAAVAEQMWLSWDEVDGIMQRGVPGGIERREVQIPERHRRGRDVVSEAPRVRDGDQRSKGDVLHMADGRGKGSLEEFYQQLDDEQLAVLGLWRGRSRT